MTREFIETDFDYDQFDPSDQHAYVTVHMHPDGMRALVETLGIHEALLKQLELEKKLPVPTVVQEFRKLVTEDLDDSQRLWDEENDTDEDDESGW